MFNNQLCEKYYKSAIYGAAIGDALGVPWEFNGRAACHCTGMKSGGTHEQAAGTFSDDTSMMLATCHSLSENNGEINIEDIRYRFNLWRKKGKYAIDNNVFDIGITVANALSSGQGMSGERDNGNGSLMRILPLAFTDATNDEISEVSSITHAHRISCEACVAYVNIARALMQHMPLQEAIKTHCPESSEFKRISNIRTLDISEISSDGYVVHTLEASLWSLVRSSTYEESVLTAVNLGNDTDTTACVTGGLAGIMYGLDNIPNQWVETLRGKTIIDVCLGIDNH